MWLVTWNSGSRSTLLGQKLLPLSMLSLSSCHTSGPRSKDLHFLHLPKETLLLYPSVCSILVYDACTLAFMRVLACWEAFPALRHRQDEVKCISVDRGMKLISAALGNCVTVWSVSTTGVAKTWRIHSSLLLPDDVQVSALDSKSGLLVVGSTDSLSVYTLILENDLPTWSLKWTSIVSTPSLNRLAPSLMYIAVTSTEDNNCSVSTYSLTSGAEIQCIPHPRPVRDIIWRSSQQNSRDDLVLYTITSDSTLRIFIPVIDSPTYLQLSATINTCGPLSSPNSTLTQPRQIFALNREATSASLSLALASLSEVPKGKEGQVQRVKDINSEGWDLFARVESNGEIIIQALANIDRRPPTLLTLLTLQRTLPQTLPEPPVHLYITSPFDVAGKHGPGVSQNSLPVSGDSSLLFITSPPARAYRLSPFEFFDSQRDGLRLMSRLPDDGVLHCEEISRLIRTPEGHGLGICWKNGAGEVFNFRSRTRSGHLKLHKTGGWDAPVVEGDVAGLVAVLDEGKSIAIYENSSGLSLHPSTDPGDGITHSMKSPLTIPPLAHLFSLPQPHGRQRECLVGITPDLSVVLVGISSDYNELTLLSHSKLPVTLSGQQDTIPQGEPASIVKILPVDPMAWADTPESLSHDLLLSIDSDGRLAYWVFEDPSEHVNCETARDFWKSTGHVRTGRRNIRLVKCSSAKKTVLVVACEGDEEEITIWDSKESQFASGLEYKGMNSTTDPVIDLDWSSTPDGQSILAIGFAHHVDVLCPQRMTYFDEGFGWTVCCRIDLAHHTPYPISDSLWLSDGSLLIGAGHEVFIYGETKQQNYDESSATAVGDKPYSQEESLFEYVAQSNAPLPEYHPQMLLQCLLWGKLELVKEIIMNLARNLRELRESKAKNSRDWQWTSVPIERFFGGEWQQDVKIAKPLKKRYSNLFNGPTTLNNDEDEGTFSRPLLSKLMEFLEQEPFPNLTPNEQTSLLAMIQTVLDIDEQRRSLDANGLRYLISMRFFYIINHRARASSSTPTSIMGAGSVPRKTGARERLRYRDMIWAYLSESQELLLGQCSNACNGKMVWSDAKALGVSIWLESVDSLKAQIENIARNEYMAGDARDPVACSLYYFALGKVKLVHGLWRSAASQKEQSTTLRFLSNDFNDDRWKKAALKNAYALLSKQRFEYAAAFFLLGGSLKDAVKVCIRNLADFQLAIALARVVEQSNEGPVFLDIVKTTVIPAAFKNGNRWLACWAFWKLHRRDLAVRVLLTPLQDIASVLDTPVPEVVESTYDDTSLALLFSQLRNRTLQAAKGTSEISGQTEFSFIVQITRVFCRMGCHALALDLARSWSFERPTAPHPQSPTVAAPTPMAFSMHNRRHSMFIDMEVSSIPSTRRASPTLDSKIPPVIPEEPKEEGDFFARKAGIGSLMKQAKTHVQVPDFDMGAFM